VEWLTNLYGYVKVNRVLLDVKADKLYIEALVAPHVEMDAIEIGFHIEVGGTDGVAQKQMVHDRVFPRLVASDDDSPDGEYPESQ
jgi:hypothetical protein